MKHFTHFKSSILRGLLSLFFLVAMVSSAWGKDVTGTITFGTNDVKINAASVTGDDDLGNSWTITTKGTTSFTTNSAYYQVGSSSKPATSITFTTTLPAPQTITSMSAKFGGFSETAGSVTLKVGDTTVGTGSLNATNDVTVSNNKGETGTVLSVTITGIKKGVKCYNITYTYDDGGSTTPTTPDSKSTPTINVSYKTSLESGSIDSYDVSYNGNGSLHVTSSKTEVATASIEGNTITVSAVSKGTSTITISADETEEYYAANKQYTLTVSDPAPAASLPFDFNGGKSNIDDTPGITQSGLGTDYDTSPKLRFDGTNDFVLIKYGSSAYNITYTLKGNSTSGTYAFDILESTDGNEYTIVHSHNEITTTTTYADQLKPDSRYVKFVYTKKDNGNVALGNIKISNEKLDPQLKFSQPTYLFITTNEKNVTASSSIGSAGSISYTLTEGDDNVFSINENSGNIVCETAGTYTVTATIAETDDYKSGSTTCTIQIKDPIVANSIIVAETETDDKYFYFAMTNTAGASYINSVEITKYDDKYVVKDLESVKYQTTKDNDKVTIISNNNQYLQATGAKEVSFSDNEYQWTIGDEDELTAANSEHGTLQYNTGSPRFTTYKTKVGQYAKIVSFDNVLEGKELEFIAKNSVGYWATFSSNDNVAFIDAATTVYTVNVADGVMTFNEVANKQVPAGNGVLLKTEEATATYVTIDLADAKLPNNMLKPGTGAKTEGNDCKFYRLAYNDFSAKTGLGFYYGSNCDYGEAFTCKAGTAYLAVPNSAGASEVRGFSFDDLENGNETAIPEIDPTGEVPLIIYTMTGIRIPKVVEDGLYIVNGKTKWMIAE